MNKKIIILQEKVQTMETGHEHVYGTFTVYNANNSVFKIFSYSETIRKGKDLYGMWVFA